MKQHNKAKQCHFNMDSRQFKARPRLMGHGQRSGVQGDDMAEGPGGAGGGGGGVGGGHGWWKVMVPKLGQLECIGDG